MRIALIVSYSGENYHGWQSQREPIPTIQDELTAAVSSVERHSVVMNQRRTKRHTEEADRRS